MHQNYMFCIDHDSNTSIDVEGNMTLTTNKLVENTFSENNNIRILLTKYYNSFHKLTIS